MKPAMRASRLLAVFALAAALAPCSGCIGKASGIPLIDRPLPNASTHAITSRTVSVSYKAAWASVVRTMETQGGVSLVSIPELGLLVYRVDSASDRATYFNVKVSPSRLGAGTVITVIPQLAGGRASVDRESEFFRNLDGSLNAIGSH